MQCWLPVFETIFNSEVGGSVDDVRHQVYDGVFRYRTRTTRSGRMLEADVFPVWETRGETRRARGLTTRDAQRRLNERNSVRRLVRLVNANFDEGDLAVTLTYAGNAPDYEGVQRDVRNYIRRVRGWRRKRGLSELRYIYVIEGVSDERRGTDLSCQMALPGMEGGAVGDGSGSGRAHVHLFLSGMDRDAAEGLWGRGRANCRRLQPDDYGLEGISRYVAKERRGLKRWYGSRNLVEPVVTVSDWRLSRRKVLRAVAGLEDAPGSILNRAYPGYVLVDVSVRGSEFVSGVYLYARMIRRC